MRNEKGQFVKGHKTWNKNKHIRLNPLGEFKKGGIPWNKDKKGLQKQSEKLKKYRSFLMKKLWREGKTKGMIGKHLSEITKKKLRIASIKAGCIPPIIKGEKCHFWKGGITPLMMKIRHCFKYRQWRSDVFTRDNYTCQECGAKSGNGKAVYLEAHHIKEFNKIIEEYKIITSEEALSCEELWNINNGITLCGKCHDKTKKGRDSAN